MTYYFEAKTDEQRIRVSRERQGVVIYDSKRRPFNTPEIDSWVEDVVTTWTEFSRNHKSLTNKLSTLYIILKGERNTCQEEAL